MSSTVTENPPADAVARDPHWAAKIAKARARKPIERTVTLHDDEAQDVVDAAEVALLDAHRAARIRLADEFTDAEPGIDKNELRRRIDKILDDQPEVKEAQAKLERAKQARTEADMPFTFRGLPGDVYEELVAEHPPTEAQQAKGMEYNPATFVPALVSACCVDPLTVEEAAAILKPLTQGEASLLFTTAVSVNQAARASLGKGSRPTSG